MPQWKDCVLIVSVIQLTFHPLLFACQWCEAINCPGSPLQNTVSIKGTQTSGLVQISKILGNLGKHLM